MFNRFVEVGYGSQIITRDFLCSPTIVVGMGELWTEFDCFAIALDRLQILASLKECYAQRKEVLRSELKVT